MVRRFVPTFYLRALRERPISTNIISGSIVMLCGDGIAQGIEYYKSHHHYLQHRHPNHYHLKQKESQQEEASSPSESSSSSSVAEEKTVKSKLDDSSTSQQQQQQQHPAGTSIPTLSETILNFFQTQYDPYRSGVIMSWSAVGDVPINLALFSVIERTLKPMGIPAMASLSQSILKAVCFFVPGVIIRMPCFIIYMTSMEYFVNTYIKNGLPITPARYEKECLPTIQQKLSNDLGPIMTNGACLWIPVNSIFFYVIPTELRTIGISFVAVSWMTYLSLMQHKDTTPATTITDMEESTILTKTADTTIGSTELKKNKNRVVATSTTDAVP